MPKDDQISRRDQLIADAIERANSPITPDAKRDRDEAFTWMLSSLDATVKEREIRERIAKTAGVDLSNVFSGTEFRLDKNGATMWHLRVYTRGSAIEMSYLVHYRNGDSERRGADAMIAAIKAMEPSHA